MLGKKGWCVLEFHALGVAMVSEADTRALSIAFKCEYRVLCKNHTHYFKQGARVWKNFFHILRPGLYFASELCYARPLLSAVQPVSSAVLPFMTI